MCPLLSVSSLVAWCNIRWKGLMWLILSRTTADGEACTAALKGAARVGRERTYVPGQSSWGIPSLS